MHRLQALAGALVTWLAVAAVVLTVGRLTVYGWAFWSERVRSRGR